MDFIKSITSPGNGTRYQVRSLPVLADDKKCTGMSYMEQSKRYLIYLFYVQSGTFRSRNKT